MAEEVGTMLKGKRTWLDAQNSMSRFPFYGQFSDPMTGISDFGTRNRIAQSDNG
jgi:hypothetical protein